VIGRGAALIPYFGQVDGQYLVVFPQRTEVAVDEHCDPTGQLTVVPSQVTEPVPTVQLAAPEQETVVDGKKVQLISHPFRQTTLTPQKLLQLSDAVHPATAGTGMSATRTAMVRRRAKRNLRIMESPFEAGGRQQL
jgi:hypothetical protein